MWMDVQSFALAKERTSSGISSESSRNREENNMVGTE